MLTTANIDSSTPTTRVMSGRCRHAPISCKDFSSARLTPQGLSTTLAADMLLLNMELLELLCSQRLHMVPSMAKMFQLQHYLQRSQASKSGPRCLYDGKPCSGAEAGPCSLSGDNADSFNSAASHVSWTIHRRTFPQSCA